jgi:hypothetical protein
VLTKEQLDAILDPFEMTKPGIAGAKAMKHDEVWFKEHATDKEGKGS